LIAEHRLKESFLKEGYDILNPEGDYLPFDFVIYKDSCFSRVQAKYISLSPTGVTTQKQLNEKFPLIEGHLTNIKKSFNRKLTRV